MLCGKALGGELHHCLPPSWGVVLRAWLAACSGIPYTWSKPGGWSIEQGKAVGAHRTKHKTQWNSIGAHTASTERKGRQLLHMQQETQNAREGCRCTDSTKHKTQGKAVVAHAAGDTKCEGRLLVHTHILLAAQSSALARVDWHTWVQVHLTCRRTRCLTVEYAKDAQDIEHSVLVLKDAGARCA
eukprot:1157491-Pelagomonas_calceolata.AAC.12